PDLWLFLMAGLFIGVTMAFPDGLAGVVENKLKPWWRRRQAHRAEQAAQIAAAHASYPEPPPRRKPARDDKPSPAAGALEGSTA
ncbi:MAG TPA: urea ABC transporter permease subunit UrtC, partial [Albitalea sp.]|nr:urea ABC transporter permease subunit UrtC [Albitalea sp.]